MTQQYVPSLLNYTGGKVRLLPQIVPLLPEDISVFVEVFCGSAVMSLNVKADFIICNDICTPLIELYTYVQHADPSAMLRYLHKRKQTFHLDTKNTVAYGRLKEEYNTTHHPLDLLLLLYHSFNNQLRLNTELQFTESFGRRTFTVYHEKRLLNFIDHITEHQWNFSSVPYKELPISSWDRDYVVYLDPPYTNGSTRYNEMYDWGEQDNLDMFAWIDVLHSQHVRFAMSNVMKHKGVTNHFLAYWAQKYHVYSITAHYAGASFKLLDRDKTHTQEVLITNYDVPQQSIQGGLF